MGLSLAVPSVTRRRISLTPLIDVVFILLVFFMLETTFLTEAEVAVAAESQGGAASAEQPLQLELLDADWVWLNGERVAYSQWQAALDALSIDPSARVQLRTAQRIPVQRVVDVIDALNTRDITRVSLGRTRGFAP
jgi:biopolymer transport protein ExbD